MFNIHNNHNDMTYLIQLLLFLFCSKHTLSLFLQNGLYETSYRFLKCGLEIQYDADIIKNIENEFKEIQNLSG